MANHRFGLLPSMGSLPRKFSGLPIGTLLTYSDVAERPIDTLSTNSPAKYRSASVSVMRTNNWLVPALTTSTVISLTAWVKPLRAAAARASASATAKSGCHTTPASAAASAARWIDDARAYQPPTSTAKPAKPSRGTRTSAVMTAA